MNKPALAILRCEGDTTRATTYDQETVEFARLNRKTQERWDAQNAAEQARAAQRKRRRDYEWFETMSFGYLVVRIMLVWLSCLWTSDGLLPIWLTAPVAIYCFCSALIRIGVWIEKARNNK